MPDQGPEPTDAERMLLHLIDVGVAKGEDGLVCPVCHQHEWDVLGLAVAPDPINSRPGVQVGRPMIQVVCATCFYLQHFLWEPIRRKQFSSEALEALRQKVREIEIERPATFEPPTTVGGHHGE
jgi:hypothetical protein